MKWTEMALRSLKMEHMFGISTLTSGFFFCENVYRFVVLRVEPWCSSILGQYWTTELCVQLRLEVVLTVDFCPW